mmetsp:Transcript_10739/g.12969  ORF Transcript_10739/g.12969 Transcript_10739/m.12969 type:complete len:150 (+) Transcript_10739:59-508(+)
MVVQCAAKGCRESFHVRCGQQNGLCIELKPKAGRKRAYCATHAFLFGQHDSISSPNSSNKAAYGSRGSNKASASSRGFNSIELWKEAAKYLDDSSAIETMRFIIQPSEAEEDGSLAQRKKNSNERLMQTIVEVLSRPEVSRCPEMNILD